MSRGRAGDIADLVRIVEMIRDRDEARLADLLAKVRGIEGERHILENRIKAARSDAAKTQDPGVQAAALRWEVWAKAALNRLATDEARARAAVEDQKATLAQALGRVSALGEMARKQRAESRRNAERRVQTS